MVRGIPSEGFQDLCQGLIMDDELLRRYMKTFLAELKLGLRSNTSTLNCTVTYVQDMPSGKERGNYLALDVAGVLVRVVLICLKKMSFDLRAKQYNVPSELMIGTGAEFFDFLANCVYEFTKNNQVNMDGLPLGFSFAFPYEQMGIKSAVLREWSKGFDCSGVIGEDVVALLEYSLSKIPDLDVYVCAVINDATGALLSCAWKVKQCRIGIVLDAGTNLCYVEKVKNVPKYRGDRHKKFVVINTAYGNLGNDGKIDYVRTGWDEEMDDATLNPGSHICEKMISSLYLGELVRRVLVTAIERGLIFRGKLSEELSTVGAFDTSYLIEISKEPLRGSTTRTILGELGYAMPWSQDCVDVQYVCEVVWKRSGDLAAASIAAIINHLGYPEITVAVDGAFYRAHFDYAEHIFKRLTELVRSDCQFRCVVADEGSGLGAALAAAATIGQSYLGYPTASSDQTVPVRDRGEIQGTRQRRISTDSSQKKEVPYGDTRLRDRNPSDNAYRRLSDPVRSSKYIDSSIQVDDRTQNSRPRRGSHNEDGEEWTVYDWHPKRNLVERQNPRHGYSIGRRGREDRERYDTPNEYYASPERSWDVRQRPVEHEQHADYHHSPPPHRDRGEIQGTRQRRISTDSSQKKEVPYGGTRLRDRNPSDNAYRRLSDPVRSSKYIDSSIQVDDRTQNSRPRRGSHNEDGQEWRVYDRNPKGNQTTRENPRRGGRRGREDDERYDSPSQDYLPPERSLGLRQRPTEHEERAKYRDFFPPNRHTEQPYVDKHRKDRLRDSRSRKSEIGESRARKQNYE